MDEIYTLQEVADKMKVSVQSVTKIVKSGKMKSVLIGRQYRITETFLNEYLNGIYGDTPIQQTRTVNPTEKINRKPKGNAKIAEPVPQGEPSTITPDKPEVAVNLTDTLQLIAKLKSEGMTRQAIADHLNALGYKTKQGMKFTNAIVGNEFKKLK